MWLLHVQHVQIGTKVFLWDVITNRKTTTIVICGLHGSQIGEKAILDGYVVVKVMDVFIASKTFTFAKITIDPAIRKLKDFEGCVCTQKSSSSFHGHISINQVCHYINNSYVD